MTNDHDDDGDDESSGVMGPWHELDALFPRQG
jgi:hypothetical protein